MTPDIKSRIDRDIQFTIEQKPQIVRDSVALSKQSGRSRLPYSSYSEQGKRTVMARCFGCSASGLTTMLLLCSATHVYTLFLLWRDSLGQLPDRGT